MTQESAQPHIKRRSNIPPWLLRLIVAVSLVIGKFVVWLAGKTSWEFSMGMGRWFTRRFEPLTRRRRNNNMRGFFPERSEADLAAVDAAHHEYLARMRTEVARYFGKTPAAIKPKVVMPDVEQLKKVLAQKRGALVVSGHTGTWWMLPTHLVACGYPVTAIFTPVKFPRVEKWLLESAARVGLKIAFVGGEASLAVRRAQERNEIIFLTFDVVVSEKRKRAYAFGGAALEVDAGPAILAIRQKLPSVQAKCYQQPDGTNKISFYEPSEMELSPENRQPKDFCSLWVGRLENEIRAQPEQWWPWGYAELAARTAANDKM
jgi:KDO2-lipid IV(A) lauroyltransferase